MILCQSTPTDLHLHSSCLLHYKPTDQGVHRQLSLLGHKSQISKPYFPTTCTWHSMFTWFTSVSFSYFSQIFFPAGGCLTSFSWFMIKKFHFQSRKKLGKLDSGKVYILTMRNDVAHSTAIKMEAARFCKKVGHPGSMECFAVHS